MSTSMYREIKRPRSSKAATGYTATATNRSTGKKTTRTGTLTPISAKEFNRGAVIGAKASGAGKMKKVAKPLTKKKTTTTRVTKNRKDTMY